jgi:hypothetical protein
MATSNMLGGAFQPYMPVAGGFDLRNQADFALANSPQSYEQYVADSRVFPGGPLSRERYEQEQAAAIARVNNFTPDMLNMLNNENSPANMLGGAPSSGMLGALGGLAADQNLINSMRGSYDPTPMANVVPQGGYGSIYAPNTVQPTAGVSNSNNFNFNPSGIDASGSYNTSDWLSVLGGLATGGITGAASGAGVNDAIARLQALGQSGMTDYTNLAKTATEGINFTPYTLTSSLGTTQQTAPGVISQQLTPQQQANVNAAQQQQASLYGAAVPDTSGISNQAFGSAGGYLNPQGNAQMQQLSGMFGNMAQQAGAAYGAPTGLEGTTGQALRGASTGLNQIGTGLGGINQYGAQALSQGTQGLGQIGSGMQDLAGLRGQYGTAASQAAGMLGGSTTDMANTLFNQQQAMRTPEQQRQAAELENRLRSQGRLGTSTAAYGGTPEQLAMAKAVQEQQSADAFNSMTQAEQMATSQQARALGLGNATAGMASNISNLTDAQQARALGLGAAGIGAQQAASGLASEQQSRALGLLSAGQQGTTLQDQLLSSQLGRATSGAQASSALAAANQALKQGDVQTAASLFNIGSSAAQLPQQMQGQNIAQAGQLQSQALAPSAAQLQQAQLAGTMGQQRAQTGYQAGGLFASTAGAGLQERLTAESAAAALRGKQYTSALGALANKGGESGTAANKIQQAMDAGIKKVGDELFDAGGKLLGSATELLGSTTASLWDGIGNIFDTDAQFETDWQAALDGQLTSGDSNLISGTIDSISSGVSAAWNWTKSLFDF